MVIVCSTRGNANYKYNPDSIFECRVANGQRLKGLGGILSLYRGCNSLQPTKQLATPTKWRWRELRSHGHREK
jgi:hypothetical protein